MTKQLLTYGLMLISFAIFAQQKDKFLPQGNASFAEKKYADAEADYRVSQSKTPKYAVSSYNLGNSIYRQKKSSEAKYPYLKAIENAKTRPQKHKAFHNLGNVYMNEKNYEAAVEAYKNALRNNPEDEQTRYNFALAKKMQKENPQPKEDDKKKDQKDKKNDQQDDKNDPNKDKKDGDKPNDQPKDGQDKKDKGQPKDDQNQGQPKPQPGDIPKERLENLLDAVNNEEKKVQDKVKGKEMKAARPKRAEKDW
ncbi:tetratricopeptide repeat protein [Flavobacterium caeni]|uniref:Tetratricopeptide repeat-containing protein n=1 Tax=Flavobacterium caeni TaxID=490189 RepID=A0A1G5H0I9_9FLAO|nr:tetratricopeptide repeat protein [Flavobacterium caeni]SCY56428.1 Tetratricopeptide repeat-containing protein [Flavobacterium caeni]